MLEYITIDPRLGDCACSAPALSGFAPSPKGLGPTGFNHAIAERLARRMGATFVPFDASGPEIKP